MTPLALPPAAAAAGALRDACGSPAGPRPPGAVLRRRRVPWAMCCRVGFSAMRLAPLHLVYPCIPGEDTGGADSCPAGLGGPCCAGRDGAVLSGAGRGRRERLEFFSMALFLAGFVLRPPPPTPHALPRSEWHHRQVAWLA